MIINRYPIFNARDVTSTVFILGEVLASRLKLFSCLARLLQLLGGYVLLDLYAVNMILLLYDVTKALICLIFIHF